MHLPPAPTLPASPPTSPPLTPMDEALALALDKVLTLSGGDIGRGMLFLVCIGSQRG